MSLANTRAILNLLLPWRGVAPFSADEQVFRDYIVPTLHPALTRRILECGDWREVPVGTLLTRRGESVTHMLFIAEGEVSVTVDDVEVGVCRRGELVGEVGLLTETPATATATARTQVRFIALERLSLLNLIERERQVERALDRAFRRALRDKLASTNEALVDAEHRAAQALRKRRPSPPPSPHTV